MARTVPPDSESKIQYGIYSLIRLVRLRHENLLKSEPDSTRILCCTYMQIYALEAELPLCLLN